jgi:[acyl-carrier-protein] S-malonyltransferase
MAKKVMTKNDLAFLFPGQGSQSVGMLSQMAQSSGLVAATFVQASDVLGYDLWALSQDGTAEELSQTEVTQPLLVTASIALWRCWQEATDIRPSVVAGHSLGEWSALVASGVVDLEDAVRLVRLRGQYMQSAVPAGKGAMAAIVGLDDAAIAEACSANSTEEVVLPVNFNSPGQVVIAGHKAAVEAAMQACKEAGAKRALPLPVSAPFHTPLMQPAADRLADDIEATTFKAPQIPVLHNVSCAAENDPAKIKQLMVEQITAPVPWTQTVEMMVEMGVSTTIECGPGRVLSGLNKRINREINSLNIESPEALQEAVAQIQ